MEHKAQGSEVLNRVLDENSAFSPHSQVARKQISLSASRGFEKTLMDGFYLACVIVFHNFIKMNS